MKNYLIAAVAAFQLSIVAMQVAIADPISAPAILPQQPPAIPPPYWVDVPITKPEPTQQRVYRFRDKSVVIYRRCRKLILLPKIN